MTKKQIIRMIAFSLVVCMMLVLLCDLFENENTKNYDSRLYTYRTYPEGTVDAVFIGTSGVDRYWCGPKAYEDYGMTVYPLSTDGMPPWLYVDMIDYAMQHQDIELVMLDVRAFCQDTNTNIQSAKSMDVKARRVLDAMPRFSPIFFQIAFKTMALIHAQDDTKPRFDLSFLLSFVRFHPKWQDAGFNFFEKNLGNKLHEYCGFYMARTFSPARRPQESFVFEQSEASVMDPLSEAALYEVVEYAKEKGLKLLLVDTPQFPTQREISRISAVYDKLDQLGVEYVSYYAPGQEDPFTIDLDPETDFYNKGHVNYYGALKFTDVLAAYLDENYDLPDRRNDPIAQAHWGGVFQKIQDTIADYIAHPSDGESPDEAEEEGE